ncbi:Kanadaptin [Balamuthia mandrillaris]
MPPPSAVMAPPSAVSAKRGPKVAPPDSPSSSNSASSPSATSGGDDEPSLATFVPSYRPPAWSSNPPYDYQLEVVKGGAIIETIDVSEKDYWLIGRQPGCNLLMQHPSLSRQHAVLQHRQDGSVFLYDLGSTHGTFIGKTKLKAHRYHLLRIGDMVKFGASTRFYILKGSEEATEEEEKRLLAAKLRAQQREQRMQTQQQTVSDEEDGCGWGMGSSDDSWAAEYEAEEERKLLRQNAKDKAHAAAASGSAEETLFSGTTAEAKAFLRQHREAAKEQKRGKRGKKKQNEPKAAPEGEDAGAEATEDTEKDERDAHLIALYGTTKDVVYNSFDDDDSFYDRTTGRGATPSTRGCAASTARARKAGNASAGETLETLMAKKAVLLAQQEMLQAEVEEETQSNKAPNEDEDDSLESYMQGLEQQQKLEKTVKKKDLLHEIAEELKKVDRLLEIAQPALNRLGRSSSSVGAAAAKNSTEAAVTTATGQPFAGSIAADVERLKQEYLREQARKGKAKLSPTRHSDDVAEVKEQQIESSRKRRRRNKQTKHTPQGDAEAGEEGAEGEQRRQRPRTTPAVRYDDEVEVEEAGGAAYSEWIPPTGQSGDGTTQLNRLFGY